ncbi:MAG: OmpP1/FadL family transporter [Gammaproteobacteria bacterium]
MGIPTRRTAPDRAHPTRGPAQRLAHLTLRAVALLALLVAQPATAINGFFLPGYGAKLIGVAGTGVAMPQDRMVGAVNPAGMALVEPGFDASALMLMPHREGELDCTGIGACDRSVADRSRRDFFQVPGFGYSRRLRDDLTLGLTLYANGGLNTTYGKAFYDEVAARIGGQRPGTPGFPDEGKIGIDLAQFIFAPTAAWRASDRLALGISPLVIVQKFSARGLQSFAALSAEPDSLSNRGAEYAVGGGVRVGLVYHLLPNLRFGAQYTSELFIPRYTKYDGLFADGGKLNSPAHYTLGLSWDATPRLTFGVDFQEVLFGTIENIGNPGPTARELAGALHPDRRLGGDDGIGFGWRDLQIVKLGAVFKVNERLTARVGWNHNFGVVGSSGALFAPIAPAPMKDDLALGASYVLPSKGEVSLAYFHALSATTRSARTPYFGVPVRARASADGVNLSYGRSF